MGVVETRCVSVVRKGTDEALSMEGPFTKTPEKETPSRKEVPCIVSAIPTMGL